MIRKILKKETMSWQSRYILRIFQHICIAVVVSIFFYVMNGSAITGTGNSDYHLHNEDYGKEYEDSAFFNDILENNLEKVLELVCISTLLETDGEYDADKPLDVTAFVNRNSILQGDYITAVYRVADLIKWSQNGFEYEERDFSENDYSKFLNKTTVYTHLMKNNAENGMNSFLNSQLNDNTIRTNINISGRGEDAGSHTVLIPRYKTVYDEDVQNITSTWEGYNSLCANITEAASTMAINYELYLDSKKKYSGSNSNLKFYITRTINAKTEVYTNIEGLRGNTNGINIQEIFQDYGRYIYFCPYEMQYDTNTKLDEAILRNLIDPYDYTFPDQMKIYLAVDSGSYAAMDDFSIGRDAYLTYMPYFRQLYSIMLFLGIAYLLVIIHVTAYEGHIEYADGSIGGVERFDAIPIELIIIFSAAFISLLIYGYNILIVNNTVISQNPRWRSGTLAAGIFIADSVLSYVYYSIIRRAKSRNLYQTSLLKRLSVVTKKLTSRMTMKQNMFVRSIVPYIAALVLNFYLIIYHDLAGIVIAIVLDVAISIYIINLNNDKLIIYEALKKISDGNIDVNIDTEKLHGVNVYLANELNSIANAVDDAVSRSMRDEKLKADLITNVSHDIKTPLTSIINYVDLLKRENIEEPRIKEYIKILENKAQRLRQLTDDLVEASKISSGNFTLHMERINYAEIVYQTLGEFYEKFDDSDLTPILKCEKYEVMIEADPRQLYRVIENLLNNVCKYALPGTRVYQDLVVVENEGGGHDAIFSVKNISRNELNISADELTERFIRGDISRSTEGSGLGLSIAQSLTRAMGGKFEIVLDGDLFKVSVTFKTEEFSMGNPSAEKSESIE